MKILFAIAQPQIQAMHVQQPVEVLYTATILQETGHEVEIFDQRVCDDAKLQTHNNPDLIFLLTQTYDRSQCYSLKIDNAEALVGQLRELFGSRMVIVAIGVHASIEPEMTHAELKVDMVLPGELEVVVPWFVQTYVETKDLSQIKVPKQISTERVNADALPIPNYSLISTDDYRSEVIDWVSRSVQFSKAGLIFANRGCPYDCEYCFVWFGKKVRYRSVEKVVEELSRQLDLGVRDYFFLDYTFTLNRKWVLDLCTAIIDSKLSIQWTCQTRCELVDIELLAQMKAAGCVGIYYGVESPWIENLEMGKFTPRDVIDKAIQLTNEAGLVCFLFILIGLENKDPNIANELINWLRNQPVIFSARPLLPRPKTSLWERHQQDEKKVTSWSDYYDIAETIATKHYWMPEIDLMLSELDQLPNNVLNLKVIDQFRPNL